MGETRDQVSILLRLRAAGLIKGFIRRAERYTLSQLLEKLPRLKEHRI